MRKTHLFLLVHPGLHIYIYHIPDWVSCNSLDFLVTQQFHSKPGSSEQDKERPEGPEVGSSHVFIPVLMDTLSTSDDQSGLLVNTVPILEVREIWVNSDIDMQTMKLLAVHR